MSSERTVLGKHGPSSFGEAASACDRWLRGPLLAGAAEEGGAWLQRARGVALAGAGFTLAMSAWKAIGPITTSDVFLIAAVLLLLPRFSVEGTKRFWFLAVAVALIVVGGAIGTLVESSDEIGSSGDVLVRFALASFGAMLLITCWRPDLRAIRSFAWLWVAGAVISAFVAFAIPDLHRFLRPSGLTPHPNHLAIISVIVFGVALGLVVSERRRIAAWTAATAAAILFAAVVVSGSRAGLGAAVLVAVLVVAATGERLTGWVKENRTTAVIIVVALAAGLLVFSFAAGDRNAVDRLFGGAPASDAARDTYNEEAWERFKSDPVTGVGFADAGNAHNFFLQVGSAGGLLGIAGGVMIIVLAVRNYWLAGWRRIDEGRTYWSMAAALAAASIGWLAISFFQNVLWDRNIWIAIVLMNWTAGAFLLGREAASETPRS